MRISRLPLLTSWIIPACILFSLPVELLAITLPPGVEQLPKDLEAELSKTPWWSEIPVSEMETIPLDSGGALISFLDQNKRSSRAKGREMNIVCSSGTQFILRSLDSTREGFENTDPVEPVAGNPGATLGEQRFIAVSQALSILGDYINSPVPIVVEVECTEGAGGFLAQCGPSGLTYSFANAPRDNVWYTLAQANSLAGYDLFPDRSDIHAEFFFSEQWYYGLDGNYVQEELYSTMVIAMHEFSHGLGFLSPVNSNGTLFNGVPDIYSYYLKDLTVNKHWSEMTDGERGTSTLNTGNLVWDGLKVKSMMNRYESGARNGNALIFNPNPYMPGSSISHFDTSFYPDELMEYAYTGAYEIDLTLALLDDIGWSTNEVVDEPVFIPKEPSNLQAVFVTESVIQIGWVDEAETEEEYRIKADAYYHTLPANATSFFLEDLEPNSRHRFTVTPWNGRSSTVEPEPFVVYTKPNVPDAPVKGRSTTSTVELTVDVGDNPTGTDIGLYCVNLDQWVQESLVLGPDKFFKSHWGTVTVKELADNLGYTFVAIARNPDGLESGASESMRIYTNPVHDKGDWFLCW